jgi:hypothetical protein
MLVAGVDVGNSTTEVAFARLDPGREPAFLLVLRAETTGAKGSAASAEGVRALLDRGARRIGERPRRILLAELHPVETALVEERTDHELALGRTAIARPGSATPGGSGVGVGRLRLLAELGGPPVDATIAVVLDADFDDAGVALRDARARGWSITGVIVRTDDGVLIANRFSPDVPVVDEAADAASLPLGALAAVEVAPPGSSVAALSDPLRLATLLGLDPGEARAARDAARAVAGERSAVVVVVGAGGPGSGLPGVAVSGDLGRLPIGARPFWEGTAFPKGPGPNGQPRDVFRIPLPAPPDDARFALRLTRRQVIATAALYDRPADDLAGILGAEVVAEEWRAAMLGAATTPGAGETPFVIDLGGGTVDLHHEGSAVVLAGAGALVTRICGGLLDAPFPLAERAKRVASARVETPFVLHHEDGTRTFLGEPAPPQTVARLCLVEPDGLHPLRAPLTPEVWRGLRREAKRAVLAANARRAIDAAGGVPAGELVVLAGGCAVDQETVEEIAAALADLEIAVARADVLGRHGPRAAVAVGLVRAAAGRA